MAIKSVKIRKKCLFCSRIFEPVLYDHRHGFGKYCSRKCYRKAKRQDAKKCWFIKKCLTCGKTFKVLLWRVKRGGGQYCSKTCYGVGMRGKNHHRWKGGKARFKCIDCSKEIECGAKRCKKCDNKLRKGKNNSNWQGGLTHTYFGIRASFEYLQWRDTILKRDEFTCYDCGKKGGELHAHHIKFFSELLQEAREMFSNLLIYDAAMLYKPLWDINNGITYCKKCHKKFHKEYNRRNRVSKEITILTNKRKNK